LKLTQNGETQTININMKVDMQCN